MSTLADLLLTEAKRPEVVRDCEQVIEDEVNGKKGLTGVAIKAGFKTVKRVKAGIIPNVVNGLLDEFVEKLEPYYAQFNADPAQTDIVQYVTFQAPNIADALLSITDARADKNDNRVLVGAYRKLRPAGKNQVVAAMPRIGGMLRKHGV